MEIMNWLTAARLINNLSTGIQNNCGVLHYCFDINTCSSTAVGLQGLQTSEIETTAELQWSHGVLLRHQDI